jgi:hypothetical protein
MTRLRKKRLLLLAKHSGDHKRWYSQYLKLQTEGLITWQLGFALLTDEGAIELWELEQDESLYRTISQS